MTNLEHMSYLVDRDICNNSVPHAWTSVVMISGLASSYRIRLIGRPAGQASWKAVFPNEKGELSGGWRAAQKTAGRAGVLHRRQQGGPACCTKRRSGGLRKRAGRVAEKGSLPSRPFLQPSLLCSPQPAFMCSPLARLVVQPGAPPFCAARQPAEKSGFSFGNTALQPARPASPPFSVIPVISFLSASK